MELNFDRIPVYCTHTTGTSSLYSSLLLSNFRACFFTFAISLILYRTFERPLQNMLRVVRKFAAQRASSTLVLAEVNAAGELQGTTHAGEMFYFTNFLNNQILSRHRRRPTRR